MRYKVKYEDYIDPDVYTELVVIHDGEEIYRERDRGEPEDNSFYRDWEWVGPALEDAYRMGFKDGKKYAK